VSPRKARGHKYQEAGTTGERKCCMESLLTRVNLGETGTVFSPAGPTRVLS
jgi:hypothetical protein